VCAKCMCVCVSVCAECVCVCVCVCGPATDIYPPGEYTFFQVKLADALLFDVLFMKWVALLSFCSQKEKYCSRVGCVIVFGFLVTPYSTQSHKWQHSKHQQTLDKSHQQSNRTKS
jgi:hypothetical protein